MKKKLVLFEYGVGTDDYRYEESQFVFENDWRFSEPGIVFDIYGHFQLKNGLSHDEVQRYACCIEGGSRLHFGPIGDYTWYTTPYYIRVN